MSGDEQSRTDSVVGALRDLSVWVRTKAVKTAYTVAYFGPAILSIIWLIVGLFYVLAFDMPFVQDTLESYDWWVRNSWWTILIGILPAITIMWLLLRRNTVRVQVVDAARRKMVDTKDVSRELWESKTVTSGVTYRDPAEQYYCRSLEMTDDGLEVEGVPPEHFDDVEVMSYLYANRANRGINRAWAVVGRKLYAKLPNIIDGVETAYHTRLTNDEIALTGEHGELAIEGVADEVEEMADGVDMPDKEDLIEEMANEATDGELERAKQLSKDNIELGGDADE